MMLMMMMILVKCWMLKKEEGNVEAEMSILKQKS